MSPRAKFVAGLASAAIATSAAPATANVFYVSGGGSDEGPGTLAQPWRTIQHGADRAGAGDTVHVRGGTYREAVALGRSGDPGRPITLAAYPGETPILDGTGSDGSGIDLASDTVLDGFTIRGFRGFGVVAAGTENRLILRNLVVTGNGDAGLRLSNSDGARITDVRLEGNNGGFDCTPIVPADGPGCTNLRVSRVQAVANGSGNDTAVDAFAVERGRDILIEDSLADGGPGDGFDLKSDTTTVSRVTSRNVTRNGIKLWGKNTRLENSISAGHGLEGLVLASGGSYTVINSLIANSTLYSYTATIGDGDQQAETPVALRNDIFASITSQGQEGNGRLVALSAGVKLTEDHNLYFSPLREDCVLQADFVGLEDPCFAAADIPGRWRATTGQGQGSLYSDPLFIDPVSDFCLRAGSPAIDAGSPADAPAGDLVGNPRPLGAAFDIGPYEMGNCTAGGGGPTTVTLSKVSMRVAYRRTRKRPGARRTARRRRILVVRFTLSADAKAMIKVRGPKRSKRLGRTVLKRTVGGEQGRNRFTFRFRAQKGRFLGTVSIVGTSVSKRVRVRA